ncbi:Kinesin-like protein like protein, partial [Aduncisulcus paluster]
SSRLSLPSSSHVQGAVARSPRSRPGSDASPHHGSPTLPTRMLSSPSGPSNMSMKEKDSFQRMKRICDGVEHEWDRLLGELESFDVKESDLVEIPPMHKGGVRSIGIRVIHEGREMVRTLVSVLDGYDVLGISKCIDRGLREVLRSKKGLAELMGGASKKEKEMLTHFSLRIQWIRNRLKMVGSEVAKL